MKQSEIACGNCGKTGVRIYRRYGTFYMSTTNRCNHCLQTTDWFVPCIIDESDGSIWGYTSVPQSAIDNFFALPEADDNKPTFSKKKSKWVEE